MVIVPFNDIFNTTDFVSLLRTQVTYFDGHADADCHVCLGGQTSDNAANRNQKLRFDDSVAAVQQNLIYDARLRNASACSNGQEIRVTGGDAVDGTTGDVTPSEKIYKVNEDLTTTALSNNTIHAPSGYNLKQVGHSMVSDLIDCYMVGGHSSENVNNTDVAVKYIIRFRWDDTISPINDGMELNQTSGYSCCGHNGKEGIIWRSEGGGAATTTAELFQPHRGMNNASRLKAELSTTFPECAGMSACSSGDAAFRCDGYDVTSGTEVTTIRSLRYDDITTALQMTNTLAYRMRQQFTASSGTEMMSVGGRSDADSITFSTQAQRIRFDDTASAIQHTNEINLGVRVGACVSI